MKTQTSKTLKFAIAAAAVLLTPILAGANRARKISKSVERTHLAAATTASSQYWFVTIDASDAAETFAYGVNNTRRVSGYYLDEAGNYDGFLWRKSDLQTVDYPGTASTVLGGANDWGLVIGNYGTATTMHAATYSVVDSIWTTLPDVLGAAPQFRGRHQRSGRWNRGRLRGRRECCGLQLRRLDVEPRCVFVLYRTRSGRGEWRHVPHIGVFSGNGQSPAATKICSLSFAARSSQAARDLNDGGTLGVSSVRTSKRRCRDGRSRASEAGKPAMRTFSRASDAYPSAPAGARPAASTLPTPDRKSLRDRSSMDPPFAPRCQLTLSVLPPRLGHLASRGPSLFCRWRTAGSPLLLILL